MRGTPFIQLSFRLDFVQLCEFILSDRQIFDRLILKNREKKKERAWLIPCDPFQSGFFFLETEKRRE